MSTRRATAPRLRSATLEIAGLVIRVRCVHLKPVWWAREGHPAFACDKPADLEVVFTNDDAYWDRGLPWIAEDKVPDVPEVTRRGRALTIVSAYYRIDLDLRTRRAGVRIASGFRPDGPMRALSAVVLPERGVLLLRAMRVVQGEGSVLLVGPAALRRAVATGTAAFDGWVAVLERAGRYVACTTPLQDGGDPAAEQPVERRLEAIHFLEPDAGPAPAAVSAAETARRLLPHLCVVDRERATIARLLDLTGRVAQARPAYIENGPGTGRA